MISPKDVITMRIPYPSIQDGLALAAHMYICRDKSGHHCEFVKCQTLKPKMLTSNLVRHFIDEAPDLTRNPFQKMTRIDCDKLFITESVKFDLRMRTSSRPDISDDLFSSVLTELTADGYLPLPLNETELKSLNRLITDA